ncbi:MAG TPA: class I SAM-dependent methyltransferase, partial [Asticcacaulis sp.]|nr:class I SAM-dependent methyltransferase [Asticcacaulis sp.]
MTTQTVVAAYDLKDQPFAVRKGVETLQKVWEYGTMTVVFPDGREMTLTGNQPGPAATLLVKDFNFMKRVLNSGDIGFCDGYKEGEWDSPDLATLLTVLSLNSERLGQLFTGNIITQTINNLLHHFRKNTRQGSKRNIFEHYDLGNSFYDQWLDQTMTYSSALFSKDHTDLSAAQTAKYAKLAEMVDLKAGQHVLEIGCGWGGFAQYAAEVIGARVTGVTISQAQHDFAVERMKRLGLSDKVEIIMMDYRDI